MKYLSKLVLLAMAVVLIGRAAEADAQSKPLCTEDTKCDAPYDLDSVPDDQGNCFKQDNIEFLQVCRWEGGTEGAEDEASDEDETTDVENFDKYFHYDQKRALQEELVELQAKYTDLEITMLDKIHESIEEGKAAEADWWQNLKAEAREGWVSEDVVQERIDAALVGMVSPCGAQERIGCMVPVDGVIERINGYLLEGKVWADFVWQKRIDAALDKFNVDKMVSVDVATGWVEAARGGSDFKERHDFAGYCHEYEKGLWECVSTKRETCRLEQRSGGATPVALCGTDGCTNPAASHVFSEECEECVQRCGKGREREVVLSGALKYVFGTVEEVQCEIVTPRGYESDQFKCKHIRTWKNEQAYRNSR